MSKLIMTMLTVVLALTVIRVKAQDAEPGFVDEAEILTPEYEDNNFDDFVGRNKRAIILFFYENNCIDCYNFKVEFGKFYHKYEALLKKDFVVAKVDLLRNPVLREKYGSLVKNDFPVLVSFKSNEVINPVIYNGPVSLEKFFTWTQEVLKD